MDLAPGHARRCPADRRGAERGLGSRRPSRGRRRRADPSLAWTDPAAAADAAWATSDTLHVAAAVLGSRILRQAADAYDRAARSPYGRIPPPTPAGNRLRQAARLLSAFAYLTGERSMAPIVLITRLAALAEAVAELRDSQRNAAQAAAARTAAEQLYAAARPAPPARQHRAPAPPPSSPRSPSPRQPGRPRDHPHPGSPAPIKTVRDHHADHRHRGRAAPAASLCTRRAWLPCAHLRGMLPASSPRRTRRHGARDRGQVPR